MADPNHGAITDEAMLMVATQNPSLSNMQIANKVAKLGVVSHPQSAFRRFSKSDYVRRDINEVRAHLREANSRDAAPLVHKMRLKALKSKDKEEIKEIKSKIKFMDQVDKIEHGEDRSPTVSVNQVNVAQLQVYQTLVADGLPYK